MQLTPMDRKFLDFMDRIDRDLSRAQQLQADRIAALETQNRGLTETVRHLEHEITRLSAVLTDLNTTLDSLLDPSAPSLSSAAPSQD